MLGLAQEQVKGANERQQVLARLDRADVEDEVARDIEARERVLCLPRRGRKTRRGASGTAKTFSAGTRRCSRTSGDASEW